MDSNQTQTQQAATPPAHASNTNVTTNNNNAGGAVNSTPSTTTGSVMDVSIETKPKSVSSAELIPSFLPPPSPQANQTKLTSSSTTNSITQPTHASSNSTNSNSIGNSITNSSSASSLSLPQSQNTSAIVVSNSSSASNKLRECVKILGEQIGLFANKVEETKSFSYRNISNFRKSADFEEWIIRNAKNYTECQEASPIVAIITKYLIQKLAADVYNEKEIGQMIVNELRKLDITLDRNSVYDGYIELPAVCSVLHALGIVSEEPSSLLKSPTSLAANGPEGMKSPSCKLKKGEKIPPPSTVQESISRRWNGILQQYITHCLQKETVKSKTATEAPSTPLPAPANTVTNTSEPEKTPVQNAVPSSDSNQIVRPIEKSGSSDSICSMSTVDTTTNECKDDGASVAEVKDSGSSPQTVNSEETQQTETLPPPTPVIPPPAPAAPLVINPHPLNESLIPNFAEGKRISFNSKSNEFFATPKDTFKKWASACFKEAALQEYEEFLLRHANELCGKGHLAKKHYRVGTRYLSNRKQNVAMFRKKLKEDEKAYSTKTPASSSNNNNNQSQHAPPPHLFQDDHVTAEKTQPNVYGITGSMFTDDQPKFTSSMLWERLKNVDKTIHDSYYEQNHGDYSSTSTKRLRPSVSYPSFESRIEVHPNMSDDHPIHYSSSKKGLTKSVSSNSVNRVSPTTVPSIPTTTPTPKRRGRNGLPFSESTVTANFPSKAQLPPLKLTPTSYPTEMFTDTKSPFKFTFKSEKALYNSESHADGPLRFNPVTGSYSLPDLDITTVPILWSELSHEFQVYFSTENMSESNIAQLWEANTQTRGGAGVARVESRSYLNSEDSESSTKESKHSLSSKCSLVQSKADVIAPSVKVIDIKDEINDDGNDSEVEDTSDEVYAFYHERYLQSMRDKWARIQSLRTELYGHGHGRHSHSHSSHHTSSPRSSAPHTPSVKFSSSPHNSSNGESQPQETLPTETPKRTFNETFTTSPSTVAKQESAVRSKRYRKSLSDEQVQVVKETPVVKPEPETAGSTKHYSTRGGHASSTPQVKEKERESRSHSRHQNSVETNDSNHNHNNNNIIDHPRKRGRPPKLTNGNTST